MIFTVLQILSLYLTFHSCLLANGYRNGEHTVFSYSCRHKLLFGQLHVWSYVMLLLFMAPSSHIQEGFYGNPDTRPAVTAPGILLVISSLGITALFALGPGKNILYYRSHYSGRLVEGLLLWIEGTCYSLLPAATESLFCLPTGAIPWLMVAELFLQEARPVAVTIATIVNWLANFVVGLAFPYILVSS